MEELLTLECWDEYAPWEDDDDEPSGVPRYCDEPAPPDVSLAPCLASVALPWLPLCDSCAVPCFCGSPAVVVVCLLSSGE